MRYTLPIITVLALLATSTFAKNVDLSTVPPRKSVQLTIYNAEDITMVRERRTITFKKGANPLQFSWANTLIDPTSVEIKFLTKPDQLSLMDTTFPHEKREMLYWNINSDFDGEATVEITYFTSGLSWSADYTAIATPDETTVKLEGYVTVLNNSGEDYEDAQVRLVVGTINLVEQIRMLAQQGMAMPRAIDGAVRARGMRRALDKAEMLDGSGPMPAVVAKSEMLEEAKQVVKEGLSEYFIFTIEGTETVKHGWRKRMRSFEATEAPVKIQYRYRPREYGDQLVRMYLMTNDEDAGLGESPLPDGVVRVFRQKQGGGLSYLAAQTVKYIPIGDKIEVNLGIDPEVLYEHETLRVFRENIWGTFGRGVRERFDGAGIRVIRNGSVVGWDRHEVTRDQVRNFTGKPIDVQIRRAWGGDVSFRSQLEPKKHDVRTVEFESTIPAGQTKDLIYELIIRQGDNAKQSRIQLEAGKPAEVAWLE